MALRLPKGRKQPTARAQVCVVLAIFAVGCSVFGDDALREQQARRGALLQGLEALTAPLEAARKQRVVSDVEGLSLSQTQDQDLRTRCLRAHALLASSESGLAKGLAALEAATVRHGRVADIPTPELGRIKQETDDAERALRDARELFDGCLEGMGALRLELAAGEAS